MPVRIIETNTGRSASISGELQANQIIEYNDYLIFRPIVKNDYIRSLRITV